MFFARDIKNGKQRVPSTNVTEKLQISHWNIVDKKSKAEDDKNTHVSINYGQWPNQICTEQMYLRKCTCLHLLNTLVSLSNIQYLKSGTVKTPPPSAKRHWKIRPMKLRMREIQEEKNRRKRASFSGSASDVSKTVLLRWWILPVGEIYYLFKYYLVSFKNLKNRR